MKFLRRFPLKIGFCLGAAGARINGVTQTGELALAKVCLAYDAELSAFPALTAVASPGLPLWWLAARQNVPKLHMCVLSQRSQRLQLCFQMCLLADHLFSTCLTTSS